ncbi:hypothetical protein VKT23_008600 [Stygiomarasmius scandens]|uniref:Uncharacterized protein n=1 Tax=Marasmiellus scandens TaxID=2682957 RepID=A0ABR1JHQ6_9AGAR
MRYVENGSLQSAFSNSKNHKQLAPLAAHSVSDTGHYTGHHVTSPANELDFYPTPNSPLHEPGPSGSLHDDAPAAAPISTPEPRPDQPRYEPQPLDRLESRPSNGNPAQDVPNPDPNRRLDDTYDDFVSSIENIVLSQQYIKALRNATLENGELDDTILENLCDGLPAHTLDLDPETDCILILCIKIYFVKSQTVQGYTDTMKAIKEAYPDAELLSWDQVQQHVKTLSNVEPVKHDMCLNSCIAYTGPYADHDACPECYEAQYGDDGKPRQRFYTIPLGPQIQAMRRHPDMSKCMNYFYSRTQECLQEYREKGVVNDIDDLCAGTDIMQAIKDQCICENDTVLMISFDGCQLYRNKASDCWIYIWIIANFPPKYRYQKICVVAGAIIPGPQKPKNADSFIFPGLYHIAAINCNGILPVWDAYRNAKYSSWLFLLFGLADSPGMVYFNGMVGHNGKNGCRYWCGLVRRHKAGCLTYFPAMAKPDNYQIPGCNHPDMRYGTNHLTDSGLY